MKELTPYEQWQLAHYGNIIPEQEPEEPDWDEIEREIDNAENEDYDT